MKALRKYEALRRGLALAKNVAELQVIRGGIEAMRAAARVAGDRVMEMDAGELRHRAERMLGEMIAKQRETVGLSEGGRPRKTGARGAPVLPTLAEAGIDKHLAKRARKLAAVPQREFEALIGQWRIRVEKDAERVTATLLRRGDKAQRRANREVTLGALQTALPDKRYGVIYADPPWRFEPYNRASGMDRSADNHYPTISIDEIADLDPPAAADCVLFLWATVPMLVEALRVVDAWGFKYKSHLIWLKDRIGTGYWARNKHELLLIATRGEIPAPAPGQQTTSVIALPVGAHSEKPAPFRKLIEELFPSLPRLEMFARGEPIAGWDRWGNEAREAAA